MLAGVEFGATRAIQAKPWAPRLAVPKLLPAHGGNLHWGWLAATLLEAVGGICLRCEMVSPDQDRTCAGEGLHRVRRHLPLPSEIRGNASSSTRVSLRCPHFDRSTGCGEAGVGLLVQARSSGSVGLGGSNSKRGRVGERTFCWAFLNERARP